MSTRTYYSSFYPSETAAGSKGSAAFLSNTNTFIIYLYKRSPTVLLDADKPNGDVIYTFNTGNIDITAVTNGWSSTVPTGTDALYLVGATATGTDPEDTILTNEWTTPALLGSAGTDGLSNATIFLFQRNNTGIAPAVPSTATTYTFATGILSGTYTGWSQTAPDSAGGKYLFITTATAISATATDTIDDTEWATVRILAQDGADGYTAYLTNESHTVPASFTGVVSSYSGATGSFIILKNGNDVSTNFSLSTLSNPQTLTVAYSTNTYTISNGLDSGEDSASLTIRATGSGIYAGVIIDKVFSLGKSKSGADGSAAKLMVIYSDKQAFTLNGSGAYVPSGQYITFTATKQNTTAVVNWSTSPAVTIKDTNGNPTTTGDTVRLYATDTGANTAIEVTATLTDGSTITDKITIVKVQDGAAGANGTRVAALEVYQWAAIAPTSYPSGTSTFTWATGAYTAPSTPNGWTLVPGTGAAGQTLWGITVNVSDNNVSATSTATWNSSTVYALGAYGSNGTAGAGGISGLLTNETFTTSALSDGTGYTLTGSGGIFKVYSGATDITALCTFAVASASPSGGLAISISVTGTYSLSVPTAWTTDNETFTLRANYTTTGINVNIDKIYSISKIKAGAAGTTYSVTSSNDSIKKSSAGTLTPTSVTFTATSTTGASAPTAYAGRFIIETTTDGTTYTTQYTSTVNESSYTYAVPASTLYVRAKLYLAGGTTTQLDQQTVSVISDGTNGQRTAYLEVYQWATVAPTSYPSGTSTYTWATGTFTAPSTPNGWTLVPGTPTAGQILWGITVTITDTNTTATSIVTWNSSTVYAVGGPGSPGTPSVTGVLTAESVVLYTYADGSVTSYVPASGTFKMYNGTTDVTTSSSFAVSGTPVNGTATIGASTGVYNLTSMSSDVATVTLTGTYAGTTITKVFTVTKSKAGYEIVTTLPTGNLFAGRVVFLTTDSKLYRYITGTGWTKAADGADITAGTITTDAIGAGQITAAKIASNTITANKLVMNSRPIYTPYLQFTAGPNNTNVLYWNSALLKYINDSNAFVDGTINDGNYAWTAGVGNRYIYWIPGNPVLQNSGDLSTAAASTNVVLGWYNGSDQWYPLYGETVISGNFIQTGTIKAANVAAGAITADKISVTNLQAVSATIGTLRTATSGARTEIKDNLIEVYDATRLRVRIGVWV